MTLQLREGGYYKTRDGRKVGPLRPWDSEQHPFIGDLSEPYGKASKNFVFRLDGRNYEYRDLDLIAEWTVRTVTRTVTEIVPGEYDQVRVGETDPEGFVMVAVGHSEPLSPWTATELKAAAAVLLELAGALDSE